MQQISELNVDTTINYHHIVFHFFPLLYSETDNMEKPLSQSLATIRSMAIKNLFLRWTEAGHNKSHAKDPFKSKSFMKYINDLSFTDADYMLLLVEHSEIE